MKTPKAFLHLPGIFYISHGLVVLFYALVGFFGYWKYGEEVLPSLTLNLPQHEM